MSEPVLCLAVWDVRRRCWAALCRSDKHEVIEQLSMQLASLVMVFSVVVEVPRDDDDAVVATLAMLPKVHPEAVFQSYFDLANYVSLDEPSAPPRAN